MHAVSVDSGQLQGQQRSLYQGTDHEQRFVMHVLMLSAIHQRTSQTLQNPCRGWSGILLLCNAHLEPRLEAWSLQM